MRQLSTGQATGYASGMATAILNDDFERRSLWSATMPALPDRAGRPLPDTTDVVVIGGGYTGINAARELARRGVGVTLLEANTLGWGASTRNGGIVHAGYKWSPRELIERYGEATGAALYRETLDGYETVKRLVAEESIDCDFREVGHVELAYAASHVAGLEHERAALASVGVEASMLPRERIREEIGTDAYHGALVVPGSALLHPGRYFAGLAAAADRAGADLHERVRARTIRRQADGRFVVETDRGAILARDVVVATNGYTDGVAPTLRRRIIPIGSYIIASEPLPDDLVPRHLAQGPGVLRHEELPVLLAHLGGPADGLRRPGEHAADVDRPDRARSSTAACSRSTRRWPAVGSTTRGAATSASRSTGCRTSGGRPTASRTRWAAAAPGSR